MIIKTFGNHIDALYFLEDHASLAFFKGSYFKGELYKTNDNRWRVGILDDDDDQLEFDLPVPEEWVNE